MFESQNKRIMEEKRNILSELIKTAPLLAQEKSEPGYDVPDQYFENFASTVLQRIRVAPKPAYSFPKEVPYTVPAHYFDTLSAEVLNKIHQTNSIQSVFEETEQIAPILNTINKQNIYSLPTDYFTTLPQQVKPDAKKTQPIVVKTKIFTLYKLAVAAVITSIICTGIFLLTSKQPADQTGVVKTEINNLSEDDISAFLSPIENNDEGVKAVISSSAMSTDLHQDIKDLPDEEITQFLQDNDLAEDI